MVLVIYPRQSEPRDCTLACRRIAWNTISSWAWAARSHQTLTTRSTPPSMVQHKWGSSTGELPSAMISPMFRRRGPTTGLRAGAELVEKYHPDIVYFDWW